jgi:hypothetical protein
MELELRSLDVAGYEDRPVPASLFAQPGETDHLGILLPGYRFPVEMPPLHYAGRVLLEGGADLLRVEYAYPRTDFLKRSPDEQGRWLAEDVTAACASGLSIRAYERITLVGKSLGTLAMGHLLAGPRFRAAACVWLTPLLGVGGLLSRIEETRPRSLIVIGTADKFYQPGPLEQAERLTGGRSLVLEGVDHSLEIPGDLAGSLDGLGRIVRALQAFLGESSVVPGRNK